MLSEPTSTAEICFELNSWFQERHGAQGRAKFTSAWDVGPGWGKWGILLREILASIMAEAGDLTPQLPLEITAFEICEYFQRHLQKVKIYHVLNREDFRHALWSRQGWNKPDLVLMIDVLEHWTPQEVCQVLEELFRHAPEVEVLISVPKEVHMYTAEYYGGDCPKHQNNLRVSDYLDMLPGLHFTSVGDSGRYPAASDIFWIRRSACQ